MAESPMQPMIDVTNSTAVARLDSVSRLFGTFAALRQVTVRFEAGQCYVLLGENGAGKSTLLRILAGLLVPSAGKVTIFDDQVPREVRAISPAFTRAVAALRRRRRCGRSDSNQV